MRRADIEPLPASACRVRIRATIPTEIRTGSHHEWECQVLNEGNVILVSAPPYPVHISYRWFRCDEPAVTLEGTRTILPEAIPPGEERRCRFSVRAPEKG